MRMYSPMKIVEINNYNDFLALKDKWNATLKRCDHTIYSTWEWLTIWWKHFGSDKRLVLLIAEDAGKILGIAPLMYSVHKMFGLRMGKIEFVGTPHSDYNDFILIDKEEDCIKLFINYLNNIPEKWSCIDLADIPENSKSLPTLGKMSKNIKLIHKCPYASLPKSCEIFFNNLKRKHRKNLSRNLRRISNGFKVDFVDYSEIQPCEGMNMLFDLHQKRWTSRGFTGAFADQRFRNFHVEIARSFSQKGQLGLFVLKLSDKPAAVLYGFKYMSKYYAYLTGFNPKYFAYSPGNLLFLHAINNCIKEGLDEFDFLRGAESYKDRWNTISRWNRQVILTKKGILASFQNKLYQKFWHQGTRLKYILKIKQ